MRMGSTAPPGCCRRRSALHWEAGKGARNLLARMESLFHSKSELRPNGQARRPVLLAGHVLFVEARLFVDQRDFLAFDEDVLHLGGDFQRVAGGDRSEEHTSELQSRQYLVCRLLLEKKKK